MICFMNGFKHLLGALMEHFFEGGIPNLWFFMSLKRYATSSMKLLVLYYI